MLIIQDGPTRLGALIDQVAQVVILVVKAVRQWEVGQDGAMVDAVELHLVEYLVGVLQRLGDIGKHLVHFGLRLEPLLFGVEHNVVVAHLPAGRHADESLVRLGVVLVDKVGVVSANDLDVQFAGKLQQHFIHLLLFREGVVGSTLDSGLVALQLQVIVVAIHTLEPLDHLSCLVNLSVHDQLWHLTAQTCRTADDALMVLLQLALVGARMAIETLGPTVRHDFDKVFVALEVLGEQDEVTADVTLVNMLVHVGHRDIDLATEDRFEFVLLLKILIDFIAVVM